MKVAIDIGSSGYVSNSTLGISSKEMNQRLVELLRVALDTCEVVVLEPSNETQLVELITAIKPSKCISIGYSSCNGCSGGTETFSPATAGGSVLAHKMHEAVVSVLDLRDRGVTQTETKFKIPYAKVHLGHLDNDVDALVVEDNLPELAKAIADVLL